MGKSHTYPEMPVVIEGVVGAAGRVGLESGRHQAGHAPVGVCGIGSGAKPA